MTRRRFIGVSFGILGAAVLAMMSYLAFADLGRHKASIEAFVTRSVGRSFAIDGPFTLKLFPVVEVSAENVRLGNAPGGSQPQMIEFGKAVVQMGFWSLIQGPPDVRWFELREATVLLERGADGKGNWVMGPTKPATETVSDEEWGDGEAIDEESGLLEVPVVIHRAQLNDVRLIYREPKKNDRVVQLDELVLSPGEGDMLALAGKGRLDAYPLAMNGELGSLRSLLSASDIRIDLQLSLGDLALGIEGFVGSLNPLDGVDLALEVEQPDVGAMLARLELPILATGPLRIDARLKDAAALTQVSFDARAGNLEARASGTIRTLSLVGADLAIAIEHTDAAALLQALELPAVATGPVEIDAQLKDLGKRRRVDLTAKVGELEASAKGTLKTRSLVGSDLDIEARAPDAARLAQAFDISGVPAAPLHVTGHLTTSRKQFKFEPLTLDLAGATVNAQGTLQRSGDRPGVFQIQVAAENLARLRPTWPELKMTASGALEFAKNRVEAKSLEVMLGDNPLAGSILLTDSGKIEAEVTSPRLDLTPFMKRTPQGQPSTPSRKKFMFDEAPWRLDKMDDTDAKVHLTVGELVFAERSLKHFESNLRVDQGRLQFDLRAAGVHDGTLAGSGTLTPGSNGAIALELTADFANVRASPASEGLVPGEVPPLGLAMNISVHGNSPRQMASGANGRLLLTQGEGRIRSGLLGAIGGGVLGQLGQKLNPFSRDDPFMKLECTVARADIVDGQVTLKPVVVQSEKVTVTAHGNIDLRTEKLLIDFTTRPRQGIGMTPGMFTNPLIRLEGTLASPKIGVGAKGLASGAAAAATGGVTVVASGLLDRMVGEKDICQKSLAAANAPAAR